MGTRKIGSGQTATRKAIFTARRRHILEGYLYLSPWLLGFVALFAGPAAASLALSFTRYTVPSTPAFTGLGNYVEALTADPQFWPSLWKTLYYAGVSVPLGVAGSLGLALFLNVKVKGTSFFRTLFFLPSLVPVVAAAVLWTWLLQPDWGLLALLLSRIGIQSPRWFGSPEWAIPALIGLALWSSLGGSRMIIFLAGLQGVPDELYDAASIDGAGSWGRFRHVTVPMITPTIFFNLVLGIIGALQVFTPAFVSTGGGPAYATWFYALHIYKTAFQYFDMGYASALAWMLAVLIIFLTWVQFKTAGFWVYYGGEK
ncbi:MAG: sugar ABC transporter permease [Chloroflexi bacterium]|nr:sugar ABC transporter permease [Chloroflexota bacterium]